MVIITPEWWNSREDLWKLENLVSFNGAGFFVVMRLRNEVRKDAYLLTAAQGRAVATATLRDSLVRGVGG